MFNYWFMLDIGFNIYLIGIMTARQKSALTFVILS